MNFTASFLIETQAMRNRGFLNKALSEGIPQVTLTHLESRLELLGGKPAGGVMRTEAATGFGTKTALWEARIAQGRWNPDRKSSK